MTLHSLPVFLRLAGRPVILVGEGEAADAKRRLLERAGAVVVGEDAAPLEADASVSSHPGEGRGLVSGRSRLGPGLRRGSDSSSHPRLAIVALDDPDATVERLKALGILVNAVDRPDLCDFTLPAIVDRSPVIVAVGTGGASAGLAAALRQRLETILPSGLGGLADALHAAREAIRVHFPDAADRRRVIGRALSPDGPLDPLGDIPFPIRTEIIEALSSLAEEGQPFDKHRASGEKRIALSSPDPDDLTLREARWLAQADRVIHDDDVPTAILDRARADAVRIVSGTSSVAAAKGLTVFLEMAR